MKYNVHFTDEKGDEIVGIVEFVEAESHQEAARKFASEKPNPNPWIKVLSSTGDQLFNKNNFGSFVPVQSSSIQQTNTYSEEKPDGINVGVISLLGYAINALHVIALLVLIIGSFWYIGANPELMKTTEGFFTFILGFIMYVFAYVISVGIMCLLLSINDHLKKIVSIHEKQL